MSVWGCLLHHALTSRHCVCDLVIFIQCLTMSICYLCTIHFLYFCCTDPFTIFNSFEWFTSFKEIKSVKWAIMSMTIIWAIMDYPLLDMHSVYCWLHHSDRFGHCVYLRVLLTAFNHGIFFFLTVYLCTGCCIIVHPGSHTQFLSVCLSASSQTWDSPTVWLTSVQKSKQFHLQYASRPFLKAFNKIKTICFSASLWHHC